VLIVFEVEEKLTHIYMYVCARDIRRDMDAKVDSTDKLVKYEAI
jgi:hypothetical protein